MTATATTTTLPCVVRLADGRVYDGALPAERHRALQLGMLHGDSRGYVEIAAGPRPVGGKVQITSRNDPGFYLPGGGRGQPDWLERMLEFAGGHANRLDERVEVFVGVTPRSERKGNKPFVHESEWLWVDVDQAEELPKLWAFLAERPAHLVILTGGSGGAHAYWKLNRPLAATTIVPETGETIEWIERANERIINHLGRWTEEHGKQVFVGADRACKDRSRVMRLAGTINHKTGEYARIVQADLALAPYDIATLVGHLPDMPDSKASGQRRAPSRTVDHDDPYKRIPPAEYLQALCGIDVGQRRLVSCPSPQHTDSHPSCSVGRDAHEGFYCHGCGVGGGIYDAASLTLDGPTGRQLRGEDFKRARDVVRQKFGER